MFACHLRKQPVKMKCALTILACIVLTTSFAQNSLSGKITDHDDEGALTGAAVYIPDLKRGAVADKEGYYFIPDLPKGNFLIECKFIGYGTLVKLIQING